MPGEYEGPLHTRPAMEIAGSPRSGWPPHSPPPPPARRRPPRRGPRGLARQPFPLGAHVGRHRHQLLGVLRGRRARRAVPLRRRAATRRASTCASRPRSSTTCTCRASGRVSGTASGSTARGPRRTGSAATRTSCCSTRTARRSPATVQWGQTVYPYRFGDENRLSTSDSARAMPKTVVVNPYFDWGNDRPPAIPWNDTVALRTARQGLHATAPGRAAEPARHVRGPRGARGRRLAPGARRHRGRADARAPVRARPLRSCAAGLRNYWGYNSICYLAPHNEYSGQRHARRAGAGVQADGEDAAPGRHRSDPRRRLQPHRRRQPARPDALASRASTTRRTTASPTTTAATTSTTPAPATR